MWDTVNDIATLVMIFAVIFSLTSAYASVPLILASELVPGGRETVDEYSVAAVWLLFAGLFVLAGHAGVFAVRGLRDKPRNAWVLGVTIALSVIIIPLSFVIMLVTGLAGLHYMIYPPIFLVVFELTCLAGQMISWRFADDKPTASPIPHSS